MSKGQQFDARTPKLEGASQLEGSNDSLTAGSWAVIVFALIYPSILTWVYFVLLAGRDSQLQQAVYSLGKLIQFALPVVWIGLTRRESLGWPRPTSRGVLPGIVFGITIVGAMAGLYFLLLKPSGVFAAGAGQMKSRLTDFGVRGFSAYLTVGVFYSLVHSMLEEYYWRWFALGQLRRAWALWPAIAVSSLAFMGHHVIVLAMYFGWTNVWTWVFSAATAVGGAFWAWLYARSGSIYGPWLSHLIIDAGIFALGYDLVGNVL